MDAIFWCLVSPAREWDPREVSPSLVLSLTHPPRHPHCLPGWQKPATNLNTSCQNLSRDRRQTVDGSIAGGLLLSGFWVAPCCWEAAPWDADPMPVWCRASVADAGPTSNRHWVSVRCLLGKPHRVGRNQISHHQKWEPPHTRHHPWWGKPFTAWKLGQLTTDPARLTRRDIRPMPGKRWLHVRGVFPTLSRNQQLFFRIFILWIAAAIPTSRRMKTCRFKKNTQV